MSNTLRMILRPFHYQVKSKLFNFTPFLLKNSSRFLYAKSTLGIDGFHEHKNHIKAQMANIESKFRERMTTYVNEDTSSMIFTEDLKNMIHLAENEEDFNLVINMAKKFNQQNKQLRFGNFVFGPVLMRMFYIYQKPDLALDCFKSPQLEGLLDQLITYQILLDLLYECKRYNDMFEVFEIIKSKQIQGAKYPRNAIVLTMAACYKLNNKESTEYALKLWNELLESGHFPMRRATTFCAGLLLNQGKPEVTLEILSSVKNPNYMTIRNLKVKALSEIGRVEEALVVLKSIICDDEPGQVTQTFNRDTVEILKAAVLKTDNPEISLEFNRLEKLLEKEGHLTDMTLDEQLCSEIQKPPVMNNRQVNQFSRYKPERSGQVRPRIQRRPGLSDLV